MDIKALGYLVVESTDVSQWQNFGTNVVGMMLSPGMPQVTNGDGSDLFLKMDEYPWRLCVTPGEVDRIAVAGWEVEDKAAFDQAVSELQASGVDLELGSQQKCDARRVKELVSFTDPAGGTLEIFYHMKLDYKRLNSPVGVERFITGYHGDMGLGHYVIPTSNFEATVNFYKNVLGFGATDYMHMKFTTDENDPGQGLHFLHVNNPRHHSLAIFDDPNPPAHGCVHMMVEVEAIDEVGYFIDRCRDNNVPQLNTLGRHCNDQMISLYVETPAGFTLEFGCDGVQLDWTDYKPTESSEPSMWGHNWNLPS